MHIPVLLKEVIETLRPVSGGFYIDGTVGAGGHAEKILEQIGPNGMFLGIDWNETAIQKVQKRFKETSERKAIFKHASFAELSKTMKEENLPKANGIILDLGISSEELEESDRGFSFLKDEPLDMRFDSKLNLPTAGDIVNGATQEELAKLIRVYGGERFSGRIARTIVETRRKKRLKTTQDLVQCISSAVPKAYLHSRIHPATRTFQALRIVVNHELENIETILKELPKLVAPNGRAVIISFHSLEDRLVKNYFKKYEKEKIAKILFKKPRIPTHEEIIINSRSRSAKLRAIEFL